MLVMALSLNLATRARLDYST